MSNGATVRFMPTVLMERPVIAIAVLRQGKAGPKDQAELAQYIEELESVIWPIQGEQIKDRRIQRGWTQEHLADMLGVNKSHISKMERGRERPSPRMQVLLRAALGIEMERTVSE